MSISPVAVSGAAPKPSSLVELRVSGEPGSLVAVLGGDFNAIRAGLTGAEGLGTGLDMHMVRNYQGN